jgi:hypothetical protein
MKAIKHISYLFLVVSFCCFTSCKDLMTVKNDEKLSGDEFWSKGNEADVESFALSMYGFFRAATIMEAAFIVNAGDLRAAPVVPYTTDQNHYVRRLTSNNLNQLISDQGGSLGSNIIKWKKFYQVVQSANILLENIDIVPGLSEQKKQEYRSEAIFMRNLTYFFLARVFGDIPYYINGHNQEALPRANMVEVLRNCLADLQTIVDADPNYQYIPWRQTGVRKVGIRPNRGAVLLLMMHINMWLVRFDAPRANTYYQNTVNLGNVLVENNGGVYYLLDMGQFRDIFRGGTAETFFEIVQNISMNETFPNNSNFSNLFTYRYRGAGTNSPLLYYQSDFLIRLFSPEETDLRREAWFDKDIYMIDGAPKEVLKFLNPDLSGDNPTSNSSNQIVFRYADALLLYAEALAELGIDSDKARNLLNSVRERAGASLKTSSGDELKNDIYWERVRELIGEGQYFYDLIRTGKIHDPNYCYHPISRVNFNAGAWTWPIHPDAFNNNTKMTENLYWK